MPFSIEMFRLSKKQITRSIDQCKQEAKKAEKIALPNFGRQKVRLGSVWR